MKASELTWWQWLEVAVVCGVLSLLGFLSLNTEGSNSRDAVVIIACIFAGAGFIFLIVALIRLLKWAWKD